MGQVIQCLMNVSLNMNLRAPGIVSSCSFVLTDEQCRAESAKPWLDRMNQPQAVPGKPAVLRWLSPYRWPLSSENAEGGLAWRFSSSLSGPRCPSNCIESVSCHFNPFIIHLRVYFGDSICRVYDTYSKLVCIISVHLLEDRCSHHNNQQLHRQ